MNRSTFRGWEFMPPRLKNNTLSNFYRPCYSAHERGPPLEQRENHPPQKKPSSPIYANTPLSDQSQTPKTLCPPPCRSPKKASPTFRPNWLDYSQLLFLAYWQGSIAISMSAPMMPARFSAPSSTPPAVAEPARAALASVRTPLARSPPSRTMTYARPAASSVCTHTSSKCSASTHTHSHAKPMAAATSYRAHRPTPTSHKSH